MKDNLIKAISSFVSLSESEWLFLNQCMECKSLKKNEFLLKEGQICNFIAFVNSGTLVYYKLLDSGNETTTDFAFQGDWVSDNRSRLTNSPSIFNIKALESCELFIISNENIQKCFNEIPKLEKLGRLLIEQAFLKMTQQTTDFQTLSASERYEKLLEEHPEIFQKIQLYHIANYLGIAPKSLSRIRRKA